MSSASVPATTVRQASRPYREFKLLQREGREQTRPRHAGPQQAVQRTNWQAPLVWIMIDETAREVGRPWSPIEIVTRLRRKSPHLFKGLAPQRISEWRDRDVTDKLAWKESVLKRVARGYRQGFDTRRKTVLVSTIFIELAIPLTADISMPTLTLSRRLFSNCATFETPVSL